MVNKDLQYHRLSLWTFCCFYLI